MLERKKKEKLVSDKLYFFCGGGLNLRHCIYYALSIPIELNSQGQWLSILKTHAIIPGWLIQL